MLPAGARPDHPNTLTLAAALTVILAWLGEPARTLGQDTLDRSRQVFGPDHPTTLYAAAALTVALVRLGEVAPARTLSQDTLDRSRRVLGPDHPTTRFLAQVAGIGHLPSSADNPGADPPKSPQ